MLQESKSSQNWFILPQEIIIIRGKILSKFVSTTTKIFSVQTTVGKIRSKTLKNQNNREILNLNYLHYTTKHVFARELLNSTKQIILNPNTKDLKK